ncbi:hypothetical protein HPB50_012637 [Hyalomma asiaticum]|uniref:Uncharacterized protein n=1 Tax=Hyalomma asiaticum TaxID=266040 RepID=A0ACB7TGQ7_HYAAI|nr:hypothetical protein HPB50_012637 [Hyalomma asiaticum]
MASSSRRSPQPESMSQESAFSFRRIPRWPQSPHGILKTPPRFFSLPRRHSAKTLRFQVDEASANMAPGVRAQSQPTAVADGPPAIASAGVPPIPEESTSSSSTSTESSSDDKPQQRGVKRLHSPSPRSGRRNHSAFEQGHSAPYWMPEEIHHYFYDYDNDEKESGDGGTAVPSKAATASASALRQIGMEQPPQDDGDNARNWRRFASQPHCVLAMLCFAAVLLLMLAAMSSNAYSSLKHGPKRDEGSHAAAGASGAGNRAGQPGRASDGVQSQSEGEEHGEGQGTKKGTVGDQEDTRRLVDRSIDEEGNDDEESAGNEAVPDAAEVDKGKHDGAMVTAGTTDTRVNATEEVQGLMKIPV